MEDVFVHGRQQPHKEERRRQEEGRSTTSTNGIFSNLPVPVLNLPASVGGLPDCARYAIRSLTAMRQQRRHEVREEESEIDGGTAATATATGGGPQQNVDGDDDSDDEDSEVDDALDDGFVLCDLNVVRNKLLSWHRMFPGVKPYYALKCNPDPIVAAALAATAAAAAAASDDDDGPAGGVGFDCASLSEIRCALAALGLGDGGLRSGGGGGEHDGDASDEYEIVYANPQRAEADLAASLRLGVRAFTFDGAEELYKIRRAYDDLVRERQEQARQQQGHQENGGAAAQLPPKPDTILRILVPDQHSTVPLGEKFGVSPSRVRELARLAIAELELPVVGVSFHCGSGNHDPAAFEVAIRLAGDAARVVDSVYDELDGAQHFEGGGSGGTGSDGDGRRRRCRLLDIGGGYPGRDGCGADSGRFSGRTAVARTGEDKEEEAEEEETAAKIAATVMPVLKELYNYPHGSDSQNPFQVIAEPGRYFVEAAFALCARIYRIRVVDDGEGGQQQRHYYIAHGVKSLFKDCVLCGESFLPVPYRVNEDEDDGDSARSATLVPCTVHGPSGDEEFDVVCRNYPLPPLDVGDWLIFDRMGAYTLSIAARGYQPPIRYVAGAHELVRDP